ncbi:MAG: hypothetical protein P4L67_01465 [Candidatus Pacebacteria bacterium]|nr:hypothetical protein [Candidatus Paceibacterota bacterium]
MLKYIPQMEKKNNDGKSGAGKVTRQIVTLKTTLKHTTDNAVALEKSIGDKGREADELMKRLAAAEDDARNKEKDLFGLQMDNVLLKKMQKQINQSKILALQHQSRVFEDLANGKYKPAGSTEAMKSQIAGEKAQAEKLEAILKDFVESKPEYNKVITMLLNWQ